MTNSLLKGRNLCMVTVTDTYPPLSFFANNKTTDLIILSDSSITFDYEHSMNSFTTTVHSRSLSIRDPESRLYISWIVRWRVHSE